MKKLLLILLFTACSKDNNDKTCWECDLPPSGSSTIEKVQGCTEDGSIPQFKDSNGNVYATTNCKKI